MVSRFSVLLVILACNSKAAGIDTSSRHDMVERASLIEYDAIEAGDLSQREVGLCELLSSYGAGAGLYRVARLVGQTEESLKVPGRLHPFTYVELELLIPWTDNAPAQPVARIRGGPMPDGSTVSWDITLHRGEDVGVLLYQPVPENGGFYGIYPLTVFRDTGEGYNNDQLFVGEHLSAEMLGVRIREAAQTLGPQCRDFLPAQDKLPPRPESDIQVVEPEVELRGGNVE